MTRSMRDRVALLADRWPTGVAAGDQAGGSGRRGEERTGSILSYQSFQSNSGVRLWQWRPASRAAREGMGLAGHRMVRPPHAHML